MSDEEKVVIDFMAAVDVADVETLRRQVKASFRQLVGSGKRIKELKDKLQFAENALVSANARHEQVVADLRKEAGIAEGKLKALSAPVTDEEGDGEPWGWVLSKYRKQINSFIAARSGQ